jgi:hypothetical protein
MIPHIYMTANYNIPITGRCWTDKHIFVSQSDRQIITEYGEPIITKPVKSPLLKYIIGILDYERD